MRPPASTACLLLYIDGNRLFNANPQSVFHELGLAGPRRAQRVHPDAAYSAQRIPPRNRPQLVSPKAEESTPAHAPRLGEPLSPRLHCAEWSECREPRHGQVWEPLL